VTGVVDAWRAGGAQRRSVVGMMIADGALPWVGLLSGDGVDGRRASVSVLAQADEDARKISEQLRELTADPDRVTRTHAAQAMGRQLTARFDEIYPCLCDWPSDPRPAVRRAAVRAAEMAGRTGYLTWGEPLLRLLSGLLEDRTPCVRRALGPGALARTFMAHYPDDCLEYLAQWSISHDEQVLWHIAMAFTGPTAAHTAKKALILLRRIALDPRRYVRGAVMSALRALSAHAPETALPELRSWLEDEIRAPLAHAVLG